MPTRATSVRLVAGATSPLTNDAGDPLLNNDEALWVYNPTAIVHTVTVTQPSRADVRVTFVEEG